MILYLAAIAVGVAAAEATRSDFLATALQWYRAKSRLSQQHLAAYKVASDDDARQSALFAMAGTLFQVSAITLLVCVLMLAILLAAFYLLGARPADLGRLSIIMLAACAGWLILRRVAAFAGR